ncbi:MAG: UvrD-helicase domain-containing protein [Desulfobacterales bacterium]|nr:UvrD-helicase domain-containing protein [Desulfobacterales bacterium]
MKLSEQQKIAVEHLGSPALVVAGAGSGKTRTLTAKIAHLVSLGYAPERILAITFTNKAAEEMKRRLLAMTGLSSDCFPWVRTYHSACFRILKAHCERLGYQAPLQIYTPYQQQKIVREILVGRLNHDKKHVPAVLAAISNAKNTGNPEAYLDRKPRVARVRLGDVYRRYEQELKSKNAVDFDNILLLTRNLLREHTDLLTQYRQQFQYLLVDEYQDTNDLQEELTRLLHHNGNLFCVGDDWQAIYGFRGSNVSHFLSFLEKYPGARVYRLEQNYRSADEIVRVANDLIGYNESRMEKECFSDKRGGVIELHAFHDDDQEARWVARKIQTLRTMGTPFEAMAVLYRTKFSSLALEKALRAAGIPYRMLGGKGFFERKEIMDLNCYVTAAVFPQDDVSFERILNIPRRGVGPGTLEKIARLKSGDMSLQDAVRKSLADKLLAPKLYHALQALVGLLDDIKLLRPDTALREVIRRIGYMDYLRQYVKGGSMEFTSREENIDQLIYSASQKDSLLDYLEEAALIKEDHEEDAEKPSRGVNLSTIHAAKGLEFQTVFVVACEEQLFPHWRSMESEAELEEERRLMYVSVTRAERFLFLSSASFRKGQYNVRSRFLDEIEEALDNTPSR